jgi:hypothetical protein
MISGSAREFKPGATNPRKRRPPVAEAVRLPPPRPKTGFNSALRLGGSPSGGYPAKSPFFRAGVIMGANHAGERKRKKAKITRKIIASLEKKAAEKAAAAK